MATQEELTAYKLRKRVHDLESENARYLKNQNIARKNEFRITGAVLLVIGVIITLVAYPSYNLSPIANVLMMVGIGALFVGAVTMFLNTERFINQKVAEDLNLSSVTVVDDLLRDLRVKNKGVYIPSSRTGTTVKVFIPLRQEFDVPAQARLAEDRAFLIDLAEPAQEGILLKPLGYHLFRHTSEDLKADWKASPKGAEDAEGPTEASEASEQGGNASFAESLQDVVVKGLELADKVTVSDNDGRLSVRLHNTSYARMCESLREDAPQVCEQIGCPLCSLIACAYTEHADAATVIEETHCEEQDIVVICRPV